MAAPLIAGAIAAPVVGGLIGASQAAADREAAQRAYQQSVNDLTAIGIPPIEAQQLVFEEYKSAGIMTPELEEAIALGPSRLEEISLDPRYKEAQMRALSKLQEIGEGGGTTLTERANLERTLGDITAQERGSREAILQDAAQRGGYGSGSALAAQLMAQQGGAQRAHMAGLEQEAMAQRRALEAIQSAGLMGGQVRGQEFGEQERTARAADEIARWNAANRQGVIGTNVGLRNQAARENLARQQELMNRNVELRNLAQEKNKGLYQQDFLNRLNVAQAKAAARAGQGQQLAQQGQKTAEMWSGIGSGVGQAAAAGAQAINQADTNELERYRRRDDRRLYAT